MDHHEADDDSLLTAAAGGDREAFAAFYRRWLPAITRYYVRRTHTREVAFDLTAETFAAVAAACRRFDPARGPAAAWLFRIAEHKLADSLRRTRVESSARRRLGLEPVTLEDADLERVEELASLGDDGYVERLLAALPAQQRDAVRARVLDERSYAEIAIELRCSEAVVRQRVHRGLDRMRERLKEIG
ncbi:MAG TPA: RNA polymerase sigma factor [Solirubrobacteraceae bacterium]|nr:RNA polymerase sigma factor [Solirubrobacteraceae bacterium]